MATLQKHFKNLRTMAWTVYFRPAALSKPLFFTQLLTSWTTRTFSSAAFDWTDCWKCNSKHQSELFCPSCNTIQCTNCTTATKLNYFQVLNNDASFDVDLSTMKPYYIKLQSMLHPDRFANTSEREQDYSTTQSALVNEAYKTIRDPLKRGLYLLELNGHALDSEIVESDSSNLLSEIFALNFEVDECESSGELQELLQQVNADISQDIEEIALCFREQNFQNAKDALIKLRYRSNIKQKIEEKMFKLQF